MNFSPFGTHFPTALPSIHQFTAKFEVPTTLSHHPQGMPPPGMATIGSDASRFLRPEHSPLPVAHLGSHVTAPMTDPSKYPRSGSISAPPTHAQLANLGPKYTHVTVPSSSVHAFMREDDMNRNLIYTTTQPLTLPPPPARHTQPIQQQQPTQVQQQLQTRPDGTTKKYDGNEPELQPQDLCETILKESANAEQMKNRVKQQQQQENMNLKKEVEQSVVERVIQQQQQQQQQHQIIIEDRREYKPVVTTTAPLATAFPSGPWPNLPGPAQAVNEYLARFPPPSTIPLSLHQFLKYSAESMKKVEGQLTAQQLTAIPPNTVMVQSTIEPLKPPKKKKKKKPKEKRPRPKPGEIQITTALDGSTLYCCPQCHVAYADKDQLEQHMVGHKLERPYVCDLCGAGLKRKEHLDRHKQGHSGERPYVCTICLKGFKRNEHLGRHYIIHSGDKNHLCTECGKGFSRKDHLAKHANTHIAKRVKAEFAQTQRIPNQQQQQQQAQQQAQQQPQQQQTVTVAVTVEPQIPPTAAVMS